MDVDLAAAAAEVEARLAETKSFEQTAHARTHTPPTLIPSATDVGSEEFKGLQYWYGPARARMRIRTVQISTCVDLGRLGLPQLPSTSMVN